MVDEVMTRDPPRPATSRTLTKPAPAHSDDVMDEAQMAEYAEVAASIGLQSTELAVESFRLFLVRHDLPVFSIAEVSRYMDELTARDNPSQFGWHWCPVRAKDKEPAMTFGTAAVHDQSGLFGPPRTGNPLDQGFPSALGGNSMSALLGAPAGQSVSVSALEMADRQRAALMSQLSANAAMNIAALGQSRSYSGPTHRKPGSDFYNNTAVALYRRAIPLHALRKIALIEKEFTGPIRPVFLVSEYTTEAHVVIRPDPFLMAVIPNELVAQGHGRFIIDVWDEPGFGIGRMVK
jgi:hypothetical protein